MQSIRTVAASATRASSMVIAVAVVTLAATARTACAQAAADGSWSAPVRSAARTNPLPTSADAVKKGHNIFRRDCEQCHGRVGHGDGQLASTLPIKPADLSGDKVQSQSDGALFWKINEGRGRMPTTQNTLNDNERWSVIEFIRSLAAKK